MARKSIRRPLRNEDFESNDEYSTAPDAHEAGDAHDNRPLDKENGPDEEPEHTEAAPGMDLGMTRSGMATEILKQIQSMPKEDVSRLYSMLVTEEDEKEGSDDDADLFDKDDKEPVEGGDDEDEDKKDESYFGEEDEHEEPDGDEGDEPEEEDDEDGDEKKQVSEDEEHEGDDSDDTDKKDSDDEDGVEINIGDVKKEDLKFRVKIDSLFEGQKLSPKFIKRATEIFEAAVLVNTNRNVRIVQEMANRELRLAVRKQKAKLTESANRYLTHVAQEFIRENRMAVDNNLKAEAFDSLVGGLGRLMTEHNFHVPKGKENILEKLATRVETLEGQLNEQIQVNMVMAEDLESLGREHALVEATEGMSRTAADKLRALSEGFDYDNHDEFVGKLNDARRRFLGENRGPAQTRTTTTRQLTEDARPLADSEDRPTSVVDIVAEQLSRTA